jgi:hypothetical protein
MEQGWAWVFTVTIGILALIGMTLLQSYVMSEAKGRCQERPMTDVAGKTLDLTGDTRGMGLMAGKMLAGLGAHMAIFARHPIEGPSMRI